MLCSLSEHLLCPFYNVHRNEWLSCITDLVHECSITSACCTNRSFNTEHEEVGRLLIAHPTLLLLVQSEAVEKSKPLFQSAVRHYEAAIQLLPEDERSKPIKQQVAGVSLYSMYTLSSVLPVLFCLYVWLI